MPRASSALALLVEAGETLMAAANPLDVLDSLAKASAYLGARCTISISADETIMAEESLHSGSALAAASSAD